MRIGKRASVIPALKLDSLAKATAEAIRGEHDPAQALPRFLMLLANYIQSGYGRPIGSPEFRRPGALVRK
jgi:hypothetical protein